MAGVGGMSLAVAWVGVVARTADLVLSVRGRGVVREWGVLMRRFFPAMRRELDGRELVGGTGSSFTGSTASVATC
jgi:hypothetical protein